MLLQNLKDYMVNPFDHPIAGTLGSFFITVFTFIYGSGKVVVFGMVLYTFIITADWISGYSASKKDGSYASEYGIEGAYRTALLYLFPAMAHFADQLLGTPNIAFGFVVFAFSSHIWKSMTANIYRAGWAVWIPMFILHAVSDEIDHKTARARKRIMERDKYLRG